MKESGISISPNIVLQSTIHRGRAEHGIELFEELGDDAGSWKRIVSRKSTAPLETDMESVTAVDVAISSWRHVTQTVLWAMLARAWKGERKKPLLQREVTVTRGGTSQRILLEQQTLGNNPGVLIWSNTPGSKIPIGDITNRTRSTIQYLGPDRDIVLIEGQFQAVLSDSPTSIRTPGTANDVDRAFFPFTTYVDDPAPRTSQVVSRQEMPVISSPIYPIRAIAQKSLYPGGQQELERRVAQVDIPRIVSDMCRAIHFQPTSTAAVSIYHADYGGSFLPPKNPGRQSGGEEFPVSSASI